MRIQVTQEDIDEGRPCDPSKCPIAWAVKRAFDAYANVGTVIVSVSIGRSYPLYTLPEYAQEFIRRFDAQVPVMPFEFDLNEVSA